MITNLQPNLLDQLVARDSDARTVPRTVIVAAHPDDESVSMGLCLPCLRHAQFVYTTDGSPGNLADAQAAGFSSRAEYARARQQELASALGRFGISLEQTVNLGFVDQESAWHLVELTQRVQQELERADAQVVLTHPYEGGHPDHDAASLATHAACCRLARQGQQAPLIVEFTSYHGLSEGMQTEAFLPGDSSPMVTRTLSPQERAFKRELLDCFPSQQRILRMFPLRAERFRVAPQYDFTQPPHPGTLLYERFGWRITGEQWRQRAREALASMGLLSLQTTSHSGISAIEED